MTERLTAHGGFDPKLWAGFVPNGMGQVKPDHFGEIAVDVGAVAKSCRRLAGG